MDWLNYHPVIAYEFEDNAVLKVFGPAGHVFVVTPTDIETKVCRQYSVKVVGRIPEISESARERLLG